MGGDMSNGAESAERVERVQLCIAEIVNRPKDGI